MVELEQLTFDDYIKNPTGGRSRIVGERDIARSTYNDKFAKMMLKCAGKIGYLLFKDHTPGKANTRFVIYIQMPSEKIDKFFYDVVIDFTAIDDVTRRINKLDDYYVRFFSNDPNFIFTYAYAFKKNGLLVPECINKVGEKALKEPPTTTNPNNLAGYVKSIYFAYLFMRLRGLFNKAMWQNAATLPEMKIYLEKTIPPFEQKLTLLQSYSQLMKERAKGDRTLVSSSDKKGIEKAAQAAINKATMIKKVTKVNKETASHYIQKIKPIGKK